MNLWLVAGIVTAVAAVSVALMYAVRSRASSDSFFVEIERGSGAFAFLGTAFAVLLAFVVLEAFDSFNEARTGAETEATTMVQISRTADFFPPAQSDPINASVICYGRAVIHDAFPSMKEGKRSELVQHWVEQLEGTLKGLEPRSPKEEAAFLQLLEQEDERTEARRARISEATRALPGPVWFLVVLGALLTVGFALLFIDKREPFFVQGSVMAAISALVTAGILLVWFLDHPYEGETGSIEPTEMERQLPVVESEQRNVVLPCDENGEVLAEPV